MKLRALRYTLLLVALFGISFLLRASLPSVATGTWVAAGNMSAARSGACTVALNDGRLLISGGADANGPTATADLFSTTGSWSAAASMNSPRSHQSCAVLQDGRVLVAGGTTSGGGITNSAEIYDPSADSWSQAGLMNDARSGATASVLQDRRVLIAGGRNSGGASNTLEIFDPNSGNFSSAGTMSSPRQDHAAAVLSDGRVLIVGGSSDGTNALNTTDIYDPQAGSVSPGPAMSTPRAKHTATTLLDGTVIVIGGSNGTSDLASAEFFDPAANNFNAAGSLTTARSKHSAFLLPNNNEVLVVGGQSAGADLASVELYVPWQKAFQATGAMATPRSDATGAALTKVDGRLLIAGGSSASAELYGFATVKTDAADYPPGTTVNISGGGWQPGEAVTLTLVESPLLDTHGPYTTVADGNGNISDSSFTTDVHDVNVKFSLSAVGSSSKWQAQNTFTDAATNDANTLTVACTQTTLTAGTSTTCTATETDTAPTPNNGPPQGTVNWSISPADGTFSPTSCTLGTPSGSSSKCSTTFTASSGGNATITGTYARPSGNNNWANNTTGTLLVTVNQAPAITSANNTTFKVGTAGTFTVTASGFPVSTFTESGALPSGVTFNGNTGVLSGTPAANTSGAYPITFTASNGIGSNATQNFTLTVNQAPTITSANSATFVVGAPGSFTVTATGFPTTMTFSGTGALPNGVTLNSSTGVLSGTPTAGTGGAYAITLIANNGVTPNATQSFTLTVAQVPVITSANSTTFGEGTNGTFTVTASGFPAPAFSENGALPSGVTFNTATGVMSGTPAAGTSASSPYSITFTASNLAGTSPSQGFTLTVLPPPTAPSAPVLLPSTAGNPEDNVTTSTTPSFYGTTTGSITTVTIYSDGVQVGSGSASNYANNTVGVSVTTPLSVGTHVITAKATDAIGAVSAASSPLSITVINTIKQAHIGTANSGNSTTTTLTQTGVTVATGNTIFVTVAMDGGTQTVTISDNGSGGSNSYTKDADVTNGSGTTGIRSLIFSAPVTHALSGGTISISSSTSVNMAATSFYFNGIVSPSPKDLCHTGTGNSTTPSSGTTATTCTGTTPATTSQADELLIGAVGFDNKMGNLTAGDSFTNLANSQDGGGASNQLQLQPAYLVVGATGQYAATWTYNKPAAPWAAAIVTYKIVFPTISSIVMAPASITIPPSTTNLNNVNFTVTFSEPVLGIDAEDFALDSTNTTVSGASITGVTTTDNTVYTVAVNTGTGNGTIQLNYQDDADVTVDGNNIPLNGSAAVTPLTIPGPTYTVSKSVATSLALAAPSPASVSFGSTGAVTFSATLTRSTGGAAVSGATVNFTVDGNAAGSGTTDGSGVATFAYNPSALSVAGHNVQASFAGATISGSTYTASTSGTQTLTVSTATVTVTFTAADKTYDGTNTATVSNCVIATGKVGSDDVTCSVAGGTFASSNASASAQTVSATATLGGTKASNYAVTNPVTTTAKINQATPTVSFTGAPASAYFNSQFTVSASTNASTTPTITASGACTISGTTVTMISGIGTCSLQASWAADTNYEAATATQSTSALQVPVSIIVPDTTVTYDGNPHAVAPTTVTPAVAYAVTYTGISPTVYATSTTAPTEPASYSVVATVTDTTDYTGSGSGTLTISQKDPALALTLLTGMPEPSTYGTRVYFELTTANSPCPTGQVQFFVDSDGTPSSTVTLTSTTCTKPVEFSTATLTPGTHSVYAVYGGDTYYVNQTSAKVSHEVIADGTTVTLATSATEVFVGDAVTLTATVTPSNSIDGSATAPSGTVQFYDNTTTLLGERTLSSNTATFTVSSLSAGSHSITATYVSTNGDFGGSSSPVSLETVDKITPTITWSNPVDIVYGTKLSGTQLNATAADTHNGGVPITGTFTYNPAADTVLAVGSRILTVTFTPDDTATYGNQTATVTINVTAASLTVTADDASRYYGADNPTFTFKYSGFVNSEGSGIVTTVPTCSSTANSKSSVGTYAITCSGGVAPNYTIKYVDGKLTVNPALLTITANDTTKTYGDTVTFAGTEFATSGLVNSDAVSSVTLTSAGAAATATVAGSPYSITPSAAVGTGLTNYTITYKDGKLTENQAPLTVTAADANRLYGDPNPAFTGTITGIKNADNITATYASTAIAASPVGTYPIVPTLLDPDHKLGNYVVTSNNGKLPINPAPLAVTAADANRLYGDPNPAFTGTITGIKNADNITATYASAATAASPVGTYPIVPTLVDPDHELGNYVVTSNNGKLIVNPAPLTVTAADASRLYGDPNPSFTGTITGIKNADNITATYASAATAASPVGTYPIVPTLVDPDNKLGNYMVTSNNGKLTINPAPMTVTAADANRLYGDPNPAFTGTITGIKNADNITATYASAATAASPVGTYPIVPTLVDPDHKLGNYVVTSDNGKLTVNPAPLSVVVDAKTKIYGDSDPTLTGTLTGVKNGDNITASYSTAATAASAIGQYDITATLNDPDGKLGNYSVTNTPAKLTVNPAPLSVTAADANRLYGDPNLGFTGTITGIKNADNITATYASVATAASPVGTYPIVPTLVDPDHKLGNYVVSSNNGKLTVNPAPLSVVVDGKNKIYGDPNPTLTGTLTGVKNGDNITASYSTAATAASAIGQYDITATLNDPDGKLGNYSMTNTPAKLSVTPTALTVTPANASRLYGDPNPAFTGAMTGIKNGDNITANYSTSATTGSLIGTYPITATLNDPTNKLGNYTVTLNSGTLTVNPAPLTVTPANASRLYGSGNPAFTGAIVGIKNGDPITASYGTTATQSSNIGTYDITPTLSDPANKLSNYTVTLNKGTLTISPAPLTIKADNKTKFLNASNPPLTATYSGFVLGQDSSALSGTLSCTTTATTNSPVGNYPINCSGQTSTNYTITYVSGTLSITYVTSGMCAGDVGHQIRQPINADGSSVWKQGSTTPAKFAVCDTSGVSIGTPGVVTTFNLVSIIHGTTTNVDEAPASTTPDTAFRWDPTGQQWIFNISTKSAPVNVANQTYMFQILLNDGSTINFQFGLK